MTIGSIKSKFLGHVFNSIGWRTDRKIIVFESDDWGMIRMASKQAYNYFLQKGLPVDKCLYNSNDTLESNDDLESLFEVLSCVKDKNGNYPVLTANNIVANPDFEKIKQNDFQEYYFEPFTETLKRYPNHDRVLDLYKEGINDKLFRPQFHGREHVNVANWMLALRQNEDSTRMAFEKNMFSIHHKNPGVIYMKKYTVTELPPLLLLVIVGQKKLIYN